MKTLVLFLDLLAVCAIVLPTILIAQVPDWQNAVTLQNTTPISCATSDGYGQHVLIPNGTTFIHRLLGNDGVKITSNSEQVTPPHSGGDADFGASITSFGGVVSIVARNDTTQLKLYQSTDGGANWSSVTPYNPPSGVSCNYVDVLADARGVHIAWDNIAGTKVYYVRYDPQVPGFVGFQVVTDLSGGRSVQGYRPKVVTSTNKVIVSFVKKDAGTYYVGSSRDYNFSTSTWDNSDKERVQWVMRQSSTKVSFGVGTPYTWLCGGHSYHLTTSTSFTSPAGASTGLGQHRYCLSLQVTPFNNQTSEENSLW